MRLLLLLPFIGLLWVPFYNAELPSLFGFLLLLVPVRLGPADLAHHLAGLS
jgi:hypothetical protein